MKEKIIIAAVAQNGIIGREGRIPWYISDDLSRFKRITMGNAIIVGRNTYQSFHPGSLPGREIVVVSGSDIEVNKSNVYVRPSISEAVLLAETLKGNKIFFAGGSEIYKEAFSVADKLLITEVHEDFVGDRVFPDFDRKLWKEVAREDYFNRNIQFSFVEYVRR
jgi:dihydrofolate reductase